MHTHRFNHAHRSRYHSGRIVGYGNVTNYKERWKSKWGFPRSSPGWSFTKLGKARGGFLRMMNNSF